MKKLLSLMCAMVLLPVGVHAQDDMYFTSKKQKKAEKTQQTVVPTTPVKTYDKDDVIFNGTGIVSEAKADTIYAGEAMPNDTLYIDEYETFEDGNGGRWINGFKGGVDDYKYAVRNLGWRSLTTAIPIGSSMYWNIAYGAASFDWNIYEMGGYAYLFPTWSNPLYWDYKMSPSWGVWGWHSPWSLSHRYGYYAWGSFYDPFFYDPFFYDPFYYGYGYYGGYWGGHYTYWGGHWGNRWNHYAGGRRFNPGRTEAGYTIGSRGYRIGDRQVAGSRTTRTEAGSRSTRAEVNARGQYRVQDRAAARAAQGTRVSGRSVRSTSEATRSINSVRTTGSRSLNTNEGVRGATTTGRVESTRSNSTYSRSSDGRNSTYTRPSSTRSSGVRSAEGSVSRSSGVRVFDGASSRSNAVRESSGRSGNYSSGSNTRSSSGSYSSGGSRSSSSFGGGGSFSGGGSRGGGSSSGGGSRGGGRR